LILKADDGTVLESYSISGARFEATQFKILAFSADKIAYLNMRMPGNFSSIVFNIKHGENTWAIRSHDYYD